MSVPSATSPKAAEGSLLAERKQAQKPAATKPTVDTIDTGKEESASGILCCLQSLAYSFWSCVAGFFSWIGSFFGPAPRDKPELLADPLKGPAPRNKPELLANPLKHITVGLEAWKDPKGPMTQLLDDLRAHAKDQTIEFSFHFSIEKAMDGHNCESIFNMQYGPIARTIDNLDDPNELAKFTQELIGLGLQEVTSLLQGQKLYLDLDSDERAWLELSARLTTPVPHPPSRFLTSQQKFREVEIQQSFEKERPGSTPSLTRTIANN